jgi:hypothetical protein
LSVKDISVADGAGADIEAVRNVSLAAGSVFYSERNLSYQFFLMPDCKAMLRQAGGNKSQNAEIWGAEAGQ